MILSLLSALPFYWEGDPILFELGPLSVRWYGLLFAAGFLLGFAIMSRIFELERKPPKDLDVLLGYMMVGTIVGARLGHTMFYHPEFYLTHPVEILKVWKGGLASHGGAIGILVALYLYSRSRPEQPYLWVLDRMAIPTALGGFFIRIGNFFNSEILGQPSELPWAVVFARIDQVPRHPAMLYESFSYGLIFLLLYGVYQRVGPRVPRGALFGLFMALVFSARFMIEFVKMRQAPFAEGWPISMGQLLSLPAILIGIGMLIWAFGRERRSTA